jgi:polyphenol oxidase
MHTWNMHTWQGASYLTCSLLEPWSHGFFTLHFHPQTPSGLIQVLSPQSKIYRVKQVHGNGVLAVADIAADQELCASSTDPDRWLYPEADGLVSQQKNQSLWVCTADCTPALIADQATGQVAAIHAGWRGTAARILPVAIARLQAQGSCLADLRIALGPAISGSAYQVEVGVAIKVGQTVLNADVLPTHSLADRSRILLSALKQQPSPAILEDGKPGHVRLDVRQINRLQLEQLGIQPSQIAIAPHCTYQQPEYFFSYRRNSRKQVQWSGIVSQSPQSVSPVNFTALS